MFILGCIGWFGEYYLVVFICKFFIFMVNFFNQFMCFEFFQVKFFWKDFCNVGWKEKIVYRLEFIYWLDIGFIRYVRMRSSSNLFINK